jgi:catechol-2,3-dioxygenase
MPRPMRFSHVVLRSHDMPRLSAWYRDVFDLDVMAQNDGAVIATYDNEHHRFAFIRMPEDAPAPRPVSPLAHLAYAYGSVEDLVAQYRRMKALGNTPVHCVNHGPTLSFYYEDPDGNGVEFFVDRFATMDESKAYMASDSFKKNTFGYFVDPEIIAGQSDERIGDAEIMRFDERASEEHVRSRGR